MKRLREIFSFIAIPLMLLGIYRRLLRGNQNQRAATNRNDQIQA